jgi:3-hydroxyacyl-[acyl-carrier-protein] dehydratase
MLNPLKLGLPHREPFVFLKGVTKLVPGERGEAVQEFSPQDPVFRGHFPERPIVPGVLLVEAIAQLAGIVAGAAMPGSKFLLSAVRSMKFPRSAFPGREIRILVCAEGTMGVLQLFAGEARQDGEVVAQGSLVLSKFQEGTL